MLKFILGLLLIILGGEVTIKSVSSLSDRLGIRRAFMGLVVVAFGTSLPEFVVSLLANIKGAQDVAVGNILGSFTANMALILGISCLLKPLAVDREMAKKESPIMLISVLLLFALSADGTISRLDGAMCLALFFVFLLKMKVRTGAEEPKPKGNIPRKRGVILPSLTTIAGFILLTKGADLMVEGAKAISAKWHIAEIVVGSIMVAVGTSIPELAATLTAAIKGENEIAIGNIVGSNIFNVLFIFGVVSLVNPLPMGPRALERFFPFMLGLSVVFMARSARSDRLGRVFGAAFLTSYILFIYLL